MSESTLSKLRNRFAALGSKAAGYSNKRDIQTYVEILNKTAKGLLICETDIYFLNERRMFLNELIETSQEIEAAQILEDARQTKMTDWNKKLEEAVKRICDYRVKLQYHKPPSGRYITIIPQFDPPIMGFLQQQTGILIQLDKAKNVIHYKNKKEGEKVVNYLDFKGFRSKNDDEVWELDPEKLNEVNTRIINGLMPALKVNLEHDPPFLEPVEENMRQKSDWPYGT